MSIFSSLAESCRFCAVISKYILNIGLLVVTAYLANEVAQSVYSRLDSAPVYVMTAEPVVLTPRIHSGDILKVRWFGYHRKPCQNLRYTRWIGFEHGDETTMLKYPSVPATITGVSPDKPGLYSWQMNGTLKPGKYFWRTVEIADCNGRSVHQRHLFDAHFEVVPDDEPVSILNEMELD